MANPKLQSEVVQGAIGGLNNLVPAGINTLIQEMLPIPTPTKITNYILPAGIMGGATILGAVTTVMLPLIVTKYPPPGLGQLGFIMPAKGMGMGATPQLPFGLPSPPNPLGAFMSPRRVPIEGYQPFPA